MQRITRAPNIAIAALWQSALQHAGVQAHVQRYFLSGAAGELPPDQCLPEIWISDDAQADTARAVLHDLQHTPQRRWTCPACSELVEGGFEQCWNCGAMMPP
jgi:Putative prokaryotic signal transducing protein